MTQEEKELLLKDLCGRLPYGVKCHIEDKNVKIIDGIIYDIDIDLSDSYYLASFKTSEGFYSLVEFGWFKPYLRPMSSMTEEERTEYFILKHRDNDRDDNIILVDEASTLIDWLNKKMFDYRGLIEKGLALEAHEGMYNG